ncbi:hypothetical protein [Vibrio sp. 99-8-1]|uniref:hypothetical protein n=1 Tax=Vibrio sp. 99-8-1 TaxID=2607602 RepID=UPI001493B47A|nr:hypothetical protein [Vibrio sp. 99-8-1]NOI66716.1 hypothetical protein [Vibrio sp. 99-8-1]
MTQLLASIAHYLFEQNNQFELSAAQDTAAALCRAWFITQSGERAKEYQAALHLLKQHRHHPVIQLLEQCLPLIEQESGLLPQRIVDDDIDALWSLFSPQAIACRDNGNLVAKQLLEKRSIELTRPDEPLITDVAKQILFTSNIMLTVPIDCPKHLPTEMQQQLVLASSQPQAYWYDHPIPIGIPAEENEILYGLQQLDRSIEYERQRGNIADKQKVAIALSVSVTHPALASIARQYVQWEIEQHLNLNNIQVTLFAENDCQQLLSCFPHPSDALKQVFGVDGAYGRHYSFLKAIAALWQKTINPELRATFKIDLDQVFPQQTLIEQTGYSAFEHFLQSNWGSDAINANGKAVHLGMIAGGLVNESDIEKGLFTADVTQPVDGKYDVFEQLFCSRWAQAISTETEILSRSRNIQRVHVTGGTNGITVDALFRFKPFTPSFIHRAEDQAYLLSCFATDNEQPHLVYAHQPGLIMRHDKAAFAGRAMSVAESGKALGDIERILLFSGYAKHHTLPFDELKQRLYPFTSSFISRTPVTLALLRFTLEGTYKNSEYIDSGAKRLMKCVDFYHNQLSRELTFNQQGWEEYYQTLANMTLFNKDMHRVILGCQITI